MINTLVTINGTNRSNFKDLKVTVSTGDNNTSSNFIITFDSPFGRYANIFNIGEEIIIKADKDTDPASTTIFTGIVEKINFNGKDNKQTVALTGRDYTARLQDLFVEPVVYTDSEISTIVTNIIDNEVQDITTTNVDVTSVTLKRIAFNQNSVYDALKELAGLAGFNFWVDANKVLNFKQKNTTPSNVSLDSTNILRNRFNTTREGMANEVWVYGDRYLSAYSESSTAGSPLGGSVFTLLSRPHNTNVSVNGTIQRGGIFNDNSIPLSGTNYLVNFFEQQIVFVSGDTIGDSVPSSGDSVVIGYQRELPIVKTGKNQSSITAYGPKERVISDKNIKDPQTAQRLVSTILAESDPFKGLDISLKGWFTFSVGQTISVTLDDFGLSENNLDIISIDYDFTPENAISEKIISVKVDKKILDITDKIQDHESRLRKLEAPDISNPDILTRLEYTTGNVTVVGSTWKVSAVGLGSSFLLSVAGPGTNPQAGGRLGSIIGSGINFLGDSRGPFSVLASGGFDYSTL